MSTVDTRQLVAKLWNYCDVLRDDGVSTIDYVEQLTYLLFLKMAHERANRPLNPDTALDRASLTAGSNCSTPTVTTWKRPTGTSWRISASRPARWA